MSQSETYVKLFRKITEWEWYKDANTARVFIHLLLKASWSGGRYKGHPVEIGQAISGYKATAEALGITERAVRTAFDHLKTTGEVTVKVTSKFSIVTICNYSKYSGGIFENDNQSVSQLTSNRQASDNQVTAFKKERKKEGKKEKNFSFAEIADALPPEYNKSVFDALRSRYSDRLETLKAETVEKLISNLSDSIFSGTDVSVEITKARIWEDSNKKKTARGVPAFLTGWVTRAHNRPQPKAVLNNPEAAKNLGPRLTGWPEGTDELYRPRWGNDEAAWLKAKALNDAHHEEQRKKKNAI